MESTRIPFLLLILRYLRLSDFRDDRAAGLHCGQEGHDLILVHNSPDNTQYDLTQASNHWARRFTLDPIMGFAP